MPVKNKFIFTTIYHARANSQAERFNRTNTSALRSDVSNHPHFKDVYSHAVLFAYNSQVHATIGLQSLAIVLSRPRPSYLSICRLRQLRN